MIAEWPPELVEGLRRAMVWTSYALLGLGVTQNLIYFLQLPLAAAELLRLQRRERETHTWWLLRSDLTLPISIIIPAYNEELTIVTTVTATLATQYPSF